MLVSHSHRFIFIHVYKVAGTSMRVALEPYCDDRWKRRLSRMPVVGRIYRPRLPRPHLKAVEARDLLPPDVFRDYFKFAFVRNPWDWQVSLYHYTLKAKDHKQHEMTKAFRDFDEYIRWRVAEDLHLQEEFVTDPEGNLIVDYVGHLESLNDDFAQVCAEVGIPPVSMPHANPSRHKDYRTYYSDETRAMVAEAFRGDIERFGYTFDGIQPSVGPIRAAPAGVR